MNYKSKKTNKNSRFAEIMGIHAVKAALNNESRKHEKLIISSNLKSQFSDKNYKIREIIVLPTDKFIKIYGKNQSHQGVVLITSKLPQPSVDEILYKSENQKNDLVVMLDQITDPQNIGSIMRSCALFNCYSIITARNNSPDITSSIAKVASGALEVINYIKVNNLSQVIKKFKKNNYWVIAFDNSAEASIQNIKLPKKCLMIFGAEKKGIRELTKKECDEIYHIPIIQKQKFGIESLNVATACSIAIYEYFKTNSI